MDTPLAGQTHSSGAVIYPPQHPGTVTASPCLSFLLCTDLESSDQKTSREHTGHHDPGRTLLPGQTAGVPTSCPTVTDFSRPLVTHTVCCATSGVGRYRKRDWQIRPEVQSLITLHPLQVTTLWGGQGNLGEQRGQEKHQPPVRVFLWNSGYHQLGENR